MDMGHKLRQLRGNASLREIGSVGGCSPNTVREIEMGLTRDPSAVTIFRLARHYHVPMEWLCDDAQDWPPPASTDERIIQAVREAMAPAGARNEGEHRLLRLYRTMDIGARAATFNIIQTMAGVAVANRTGTTDADIGRGLKAAEDTRDVALQHAQEAEAKRQQVREAIARGEEEHRQSEHPGRRGAAKAG